MRKQQLCGDFGGRKDTQILENRKSWVGRTASSKLQIM